MHCQKQYDLTILNANKSLDHIILPSNDTYICRMGLDQNQNSHVLLNLLYSFADISLAKFRIKNISASQSAMTPELFAHLEKMNGHMLYYGVFIPKKEDESVHTSLDSRGSTTDTMSFGGHLQRNTVLSKLSGVALKINVVKSKSMVYNIETEHSGYVLTIEGIW